jgi:hypothetical protein
MKEAREEAIVNDKRYLGESVVKKRRRIVQTSNPNI